MALVVGNYAVNAPIPLQRRPARWICTRMLRLWVWISQYAGVENVLATDHGEVLLLRSRAWMQLIWRQAQHVDALQAQHLTVRV